jgi:hypothetical protein
MLQIKDALLPELTERLLSFDLPRASRRGGHCPFSITVEALTPVDTNRRVATSDTTPRTTDITMADQATVTFERRQNEVN